MPSDGQHGRDHAVAQHVGVPTDIKGAAQAEETVLIGELDAFFHVNHAGGMLVGDVRWFGEIRPVAGRANPSQTVFLGHERLQGG